MHNCIVSGFRFLPGVSVSRRRRQSASPRGDDPLIQTRRLLLCTLRSVVPFPRLGPPRFQLGTPKTHPPQVRSNSARLPGCRAYRQGKLDTPGTIVDMSFSCWPAATPPHRGATEIDHHRDLVPARQPGEAKQPAWPVSFVMGRALAHIRRPFSRRDGRYYAATLLTGCLNSAEASVRVFSGPQAGSASLGFVCTRDMFFDNRAVSRSDRLGQRLFSTHLYRASSTIHHRLLGLINTQVVGSDTLRRLGTRLTRLSSRYINTLSLIINNLDLCRCSMARHTCQYCLSPTEGTPKSTDFGGAHGVCLPGISVVSVVSGPVVQIYSLF